MRNLVNILSVSRIIFGLLIFYFLSDPDLYIYTIPFFAIAGLSDFLDGYLARKYKVESTIGEIIDPIADKVLVTFVLIALCVNLQSLLIALCSSIIISRELFVSALRDFNSRNNNLKATKVLYISKVKTAIQFNTILLYLISITFSLSLITLISDILLIMTTLITCYTGLEYAKNSLKDEN